MGFSIIVRVYDDGIGVSYVLHGRKNSTEFTIENDLTQYKLSTNATIWAANGERHNFSPVSVDSLLQEKMLLTPVVLRLITIVTSGL